MDTSPGYPPHPGFTQVRLYQGWGGEQTGQTHPCWPFLSSPCSGTGLGWLLPHCQSQMLGSCSADTWSRHPAPATPASPCLPHLVPQSQTVVNTPGSRWARGVLKYPGPW